jgi:hypothetical protein
MLTIYLEAGWVVVHVCNPNYLGGGDRKEFKASLSKVGEDLSQKQKGWWCSSSGRMLGPWGGGALGQGEPNIFRDNAKRGIFIWPWKTSTNSKFLSFK